MNSRKRIPRRDFMKGVAGVAGASVLASCAPKATPTTTAATAAPTAAPTAASVLKYGDEACIHHHITGGYAGPGPEDELIIQLEEEALREQYGLNVKITWESASWSDIDTLMTTRLSTKACDSLERDGFSVLNWLSDPGLLRDIEDVLTEYGTHLPDSFSQAAFDFFTLDGNRYSFANFYAAPVDCEYISIRRDWCDKVDRDVPQTLEELEEVLRLFKEKNLGGDVTIPCSPELGGWLIPSYVLMGPFAPGPEEQFKMMEEGVNFEYELGCAMREERLDLIRRWYQDGLLNPEWPTFKSEDNQSAVDKGIVGCVLSGYWYANGPLQTTEREIDPTQDWVQIYPPLGLKGKPETGCILTEIPLERGVAVTSWANCPEAIIALCDWINTSWENYMLTGFGIEGKHWEWGDNGCYVDLRSLPPNEEYSGMPRVVQANKWQNKFRTLPPCPGNEPKDSMIDQRIFGPHIYNRPQITTPQQGEYPSLTRIFHFVPWRFTESAQLEPDFRALRDEWATKIIKGEVGVTDGVQQFWDLWNAAGGDIRTRELTDQYNAYAQAHPEMQDPKIFLSPENWNTEIKYPERKTA